MIVVVVVDVVEVEVVVVMVVLDGVVVISCSHFLLVGLSFDYSC